MTKKPKPKVIKIKDKADKKKPRIARDWEAIGIDYRAGLLSIRAVGRKHKIDEAQLRRYAKKKKWEP